MSRFLNRLRKGVDGLLAPAPPPVSPATTVLAGPQTQLARIGAARQRLEQTNRVLGERQQAMQQHAEMLQSEAVQHVARGRHDLAFASLTRRHTTLRAVDALTAQRTDLETHITRVVQIEQQLLTRIDAITQRNDLLTAQQQAALVQIQLGETLTGLNDATSFPTGTDGLEENAVETLQLQATAIRRLIDDGLIDLPFIDDQSIDPDLKSTIDTELAAIQQQIAEHARPQPQRSQS